MKNANISLVSNETPFLEEARRVLTLEAEALKQLSAFLDHQFEDAIHVLANIKGRIIVTGMGKSGHVARKIAATFASTGTPAFFVHPSEASHGDLGMITPDDAVLMLSNGGESPELSDVIMHAKRFSIPLIAITRNAESTLGKAASHVLLMPKQPEACPIGLAPTTSTTMTMALGDAIASSLMVKKNFSKDAYKLFHPGGLLGQKLVKISEIMHKGDDLPLVQKEKSMADTIVLMTQTRLGCVGVMDGEQLIGTVTDGDLRRHMQESMLSLKAADVMTKAPKTIHEDALAVEALAFMNKHAIRHLFVMRDEKVVGILEIHDCLRYAG